jgi:hypothetical protein
MVLNLSLDECINKTHDLVTKKIKRKETNKKNPQQAIESQRKAKSKITLRTMCGSRTGGWSLPCVMSD